MSTVVYMYSICICSQDQVPTKLLFFFSKSPSLPDRSSSFLLYLCTTLPCFFVVFFCSVFHAGDRLVRILAMAVNTVPSSDPFGSEKVKGGWAAVCSFPSVEFGCCCPRHCWKSVTQRLLCGVLRRNQKVGTMEKNNIFLLCSRIGWRRHKDSEKISDTEQDVVGFVIY